MHLLSKLLLLETAKIPGAKVDAAMTKIISYLEKSLGFKLIKIPGVEHFTNSSSHGWGVRYVIDGTTKCIRFNWESAPQAGKSNSIESIDVWTGGSHDPAFHLRPNGVSLVKVLPALAAQLENPKYGKVLVFANDKPALSEGLITEAKRGEFTPEQALSDFLAKMFKNPLKSFTRTDFINFYHIANVDVFDTMVAEFSDKIEINGKRVSAKDGVDIGALKSEILAKSDGYIEITKGGSGETYLATSQEAAVDDEDEKVSFSDSLDHLEGLVQGIVKGSFNALFVAGKGGSLSGSTSINVIMGDSDNTTVTMEWLEDLVKQTFGINELELLELYKLDNVKIETPDGFVKALGFMKKKGKKAIVEFESGIVHECLHNHMYIPADHKTVHAYNLAPGRQILTKNGDVDIVKSVTLSEEEMFAYDLSVDALNGVYVTADGIQHHNTGKTQTVEDVLHASGLRDGDGYFKNTGTASAVGIYSLLFRHRKDIILFDDSDGALGDQDSRNLIKAATDTKKIRKLVWNKKSSNMVDPEFEDIDDMAEDDDRIPKYFNFEGRIIFISNLPLDKLDPDKALRTRAFVISINPTSTELLERMEQILHKIPLEDGLNLTKAERVNVMEIVKNVKRKDEVSLRTLVRALNLAASGASNWEQLVKLYS